MVEPSPDQIRWNQFRKQHLLNEKPHDFYELTKAQLGLHSTDYWTPYFSAWARLGNFDAKRMFESLNSGDRLVRTHAFRTTLHVMHIDNLSLILSATGPSLYRAARNDKYRKTDQLNDSEIERLLSRVRKTLENRPLQMSELKRAMPGLDRYLRSALIMLMAKGEVVRATASHARNNLTSYALMSSWVNGPPIELRNEKQSISELIQRHIERFGPVSVDDIAWWLRVTKASVKTSLSELGEIVTKIMQQGQERYMIVSDYEVASSLEEPNEDTTWFLPYEDHFLKAFIDREAYISADIQPKLFPADRRHFWPSNPNAPRVMPSKGLRATGEVRPSVWLNGEVVGRWEIDDDTDQKRVVMNIYRKIASEHQASIEQERMKLESFVNDALQPISGGS